MIRAPQICGIVICVYAVKNNQNMMLYALKSTQNMTLYAVMNLQILYFLLNILYYWPNFFLSVFFIKKLKLQPLNVTIIF